MFKNCIRRVFLSARKRLPIEAKGFNLYSMNLDAINPTIAEIEIILPYFPSLIEKLIVE